MISRDMQNNRTQPKLQSGEYTRIWGPMQALQEFEQYSTYLEQEICTLTWKFPEFPEEQKSMARETCRILNRLGGNAYEIFYLEEQDRARIHRDLIAWIHQLASRDDKSKDLKWHLVRLRGKTVSYLTAFSKAGSHYQRIIQDLQRFLVSGRVDFNDFLQTYQDLESISNHLKSYTPITEEQKKAIASLVEITEQIRQFDLRNSIREHRRPDTTPIDEVHAMIDRMQDLAKPPKIMTLEICPNPRAPREDTTLRARKPTGMTCPGPRAHKERWHPRNSKI